MTSGRTVFMNPRRIALMAVFVGCITTGLVYLQVARMMKPAPAAVATVAVVTATKPVAVNSAIQPDGVSVVRMPQELVPAGVFGDPSKVVGRIARFPILANEPIRSDRLIEDDKRAGLSYKVPEGSRAVTIQVNEVSGLAGMIQPGDFVDVMATIDDPKLQTPTTITVLQNVQVLAIAQDTIVDPQKKPKVVTNVTIVVKPGQAEKVSLAAERGALRLALRGQHQSEIATVIGADLEHVLQEGRPQRGTELLNEPQLSEITIIRGSSQTQILAPTRFATSR